MRRHFRNHGRIEMRFLLSVAVMILLGGLLPPTRAIGADQDSSLIIKGEKLYAERHCSACHMIQGKGGKIGPDLSDVGKRREADWLSKFLKDPNRTVTGAKMLPVKGSEEEISALVTYLRSLK